MTYNQLVFALKERDSERKRFVDSSKAIVLDGIHSIVDDRYYIGWFGTYESYLLSICKSGKIVFHKPFKIDETIYYLLAT